MTNKLTKIPFIIILLISKLQMDLKQHLMKGFHYLQFDATLLYFNQNINER